MWIEVSTSPDQLLAFTHLLVYMIKLSSNQVMSLEFIIQICLVITNWNLEINAMNETTSIRIVTLEIFDV